MIKKEVKRRKTKKSKKMVFATILTTVILISVFTVTATAFMSESGWESPTYYSEFYPEIDYDNRTLGDFINNEKVIMEESRIVCIWGDPVAPLKNPTLFFTPINGNAFEGGYYLSTGECVWWSNLIPNSSVNGSYSFNLPDFTNLECCIIKILPAEEKVELESGIIVSRIVNKRIFNDTGVQNLIVSVTPMDINADWIEIYVIPTKTSDIDISVINSSGWEKTFESEFETEYYICVSEPVIGKNYSFPISLQIHPNNGKIAFVPEVRVTYGIEAPKLHVGWTNEVIVSDPRVGTARIHTDNQINWTISTSAEIQKSFNLEQIVNPAATFDTGAGTYPSIMGTHKGEIKPSDNINVSKLYTYSCVGTGGHTETIKLYEGTTLIASGTWNGYQDDYHNISILSPSVTLLAGHTYNYTIVTGSYPQIIHATSKKVTGGTITCTSFVDANGKTYVDWIPAIRLE